MSSRPISDVNAGDLRYRVQFQKRAAAADGAGNVEGDWTTQFTRWARITPLKGGEEVTARRLQGMQPAIIRVRSDSATQTITPQWRAIDVIRDTTYNVKTISNVDEQNIWLDMMCESGGPS